MWDPGITLHIYHVPVTLQSFSRDLILLGLTYTSWRCTGRDIRTLNDYTWHPIVEVAKLFLGIFVTIIPVLAMLKAETQPLVRFLVRILYTDVGEPVNSVVFWVTGLHSSILDNAPSYLIFFNALGGDAQVLMTQLPGSLLAISAGAVFMGAMTYIGNGPNFMVKSIAEDME